jgi:hypothetical protein
MQDRLRLTRICGEIKRRTGPEVIEKTMRGIEECLDELAMEMGEYNEY